MRLNTFGNETRPRPQMLLKYHINRFLHLIVAYKSLITKHEFERRWRTTCYNKARECFKLPLPKSHSPRVWASIPVCTVTSASCPHRPKQASYFAALTWI